MARLIPQPEEYDHASEERIRNLITETASYAESGTTFDESGEYLCGTCDQRLLPNKCASVGFVQISMKRGGCCRWESGDPEFDGFPTKSKPWLVGYGERKKGFGCKRCEYATEADEADGERTLWCGFWGLRVLPNACCQENDGKDLVEPYTCEIKEPKKKSVAEKVLGGE